MRSTIWILISCVLLASGASCFSRGQRFHHFTTTTPIPEGDTLILGFQGGRDEWNNHKTGVGRLAAKLRSANLPVHVETVVNKKRKIALDLVLLTLDRDQNGRLSSEENASARIILYGQSFGGAAVVKFAQQLHDAGVPVLLTVQVDSVGRKDAVIPANVLRAANLFQKNGRIIRGEPQIRAADPDKTKIVANIEFDYRNRNIPLAGIPWYKLIFRVAHAKMDRDPEVWNLVEKLILESLQETSTPKKPARRPAVFAMSAGILPASRSAGFQPAQLARGRRYKRIVRKLAFCNAGVPPARFLQNV